MRLFRKVGKTFRTRELDLKKESEQAPMNNTAQTEARIPVRSSIKLEVSINTQDTNTKSGLNTSKQMPTISVREDIEPLLFKTRCQHFLTGAPGLCQSI